MIQTADMLRIFDKHRGDAIVVPGRGGRHWIKISRRARRATCRSATPRWAATPRFALGLALARPERKCRAVRLRGRSPDEPRHPADHRRAGAGELLSLHARQRVLRDDRRPARAQREERRLRRDRARRRLSARATPSTDLDDLEAKIAGHPGRAGAGVRGDEGPVPRSRTCRSASARAGRRGRATASSPTSAPSSASPRSPRSASRARPHRRRVREGGAAGGLPGPQCSQPAIRGIRAPRSAVAGTSTPEAWVQGDPRGSPLPDAPAFPAR